jgi:GAF domain-containing protein
VWTTLADRTGTNSAAVDRTVRVRASIARCAAERDSPVRVSHACLGAALAVGVDGAALVVVTGRGVREPMFVSDELAERVAELQNTLGEGPAIDAFHSRGPVLVADLGSAEVGRRWPAFAQQAHQAGVGAVFSLPARAGAARLGVLDLYRCHAGPLSRDELSDALVYTEAALALALDDRARLAEPYTASNTAPEAPIHPPTELAEGPVGDLFVDRGVEVHQATGMVSAQLEIDVTEALARLRAYAFAHDLRLCDVAHAVLRRRLRLDRTAEPPTSGDTAR